MLLHQAIEKFLRSKEADGCSNRTIDTYRRRLAGFQSFVEARGHTHVDEITPEDLDDWVVSLRRQQHKFEGHPFRERQDGTLSKATRAGRIQVVKTLFNWCFKQGYLPHSPAAHLEQPRLGKSAGDKSL